MKVLSLFDGMSCGQIALKQLGIKVDTYYSSEIDKYAMQITQKNFPDTIQVGDICNLDPKDFMDVDLIQGGSPCQGFSFAGKQLAFDDPRSALFFEFIRLLKAIKPKYFLLENVRMKKEFLEVITEQVSSCYTADDVAPEFKDVFGNVKFEPHFINASLVSAQSRQRYYWTNIPGVKQPKDRGIVLRDILENDAEEPMFSNIYGGFGEKKPREHFNKSITIRANSGGGSIPNIKLKDFDKNLSKMTTKDNKSFCLTSSYNGAVAWNSLQRKQRTMIPTTTSENDITNIKKGTSGKSWFFEQQTYSKDSKKTRALKAGVGSGNIPKILETQTKIVDKEINWRKLTPVECERLQTVPDNYTEGVSNTQRYRMLGNGWCVAVIEHIYQNMEI